jgi:CubicO group peptidase (beta-lactamase class C family)
MLPSQIAGVDEWLQKLGSLPLMAQPGERWMYHVSGDVLGALIGRVSGQGFGNFLRERIFDPLGMKDTGFHVHACRSEGDWPSRRYYHRPARSGSEQLHSGAEIRRAGELGETGCGFPPAGLALRNVSDAARPSQGGRPGFPVEQPGALGS